MPTWTLNGLSFGINIGETYGGMMVGLLISTLLCGVAGIQAAIFFCAKKTDPLSHKIAVAILWVLDVLQLCFVFNATYFYVVDQVGIRYPPFVWSLKIQVFMTTLATSLTKLFYMGRLWKLRQFISKWILIGMIFLLVCDYALGTVFSYEVFTVDFLHDLLTISFKPVVLLSMCSTAASDFLVGGALIYVFAKSNTNLSWTNSSLTMLIAYLVNTGIATGLFSVAVIIAYAIGVENPVFIFSEVALPQLYINCCLSMFNASVYFQTEPDSQRSAIIHIFPNFHDDPRNYNILYADCAGQPCRSLSTNNSGSAINAKLSSSEMASDMNVPTINEIGLPLFKVVKVNEPQRAVRQIPVEVVVQRTQHAVTSDIRNARGDTVVVPP
ncbi:hypothetical protein FB446DRAFT_495079 [Lentinula raphanica]|nr:hypothetical protein FB446DRAFT_495079 [Lentinula raphanica]